MTVNFRKMQAKLFLYFFRTYQYLFLVLPACLISGIAAAQTSWQPYLASVSFKIKNAGLNVTGNFKGFKGQILFDPNALSSSSLNGSVDVSTINTGITKRDHHLISDDYFDAGKYKLIEVHSKHLYKKEDAFAGIFNVTIKNVTKEVEIPFSFTTDGNNGIFDGSFTIDRRDFGVGGNSFIMGDNVTVSIVVNAKKHGQESIK